MDITVAITTCNRPERLAQGLEALGEQEDYSANLEVVVADNGEPTGTRAVADAFASRFDNFRYLHDPRPGQLVGWHRSLALAVGEVVCFIDDDAVPDRTWLAGIADAYRDPQVAMATGPIRPHYEISPPEWVAEMTLGEPEAETMPLFGLLNFGKFVRDIPGSFVWGTNFTVRRNRLIEVGGFHPCAMPGYLLKFYGDGEIAVGQAIAAAGHKIVYHPLVAVRHVIPSYRFSDAAIKSKFFTAGCARSFQTLREMGVPYPSPTEAELDGIAVRYLRRGADGPKQLFYLVRDGLRNGIHTHLSAFAGDPEFRQWVLWEDYLDLDRCYCHPELKTNNEGAMDWRAGAAEAC